MKTPLHLLAAAFIAAASALAHAQQLASVRVASGLRTPVFVASPVGDDSRLFIVDQDGKIKILNLPGNTLNGADFLSISPIVSGGEAGLLGMAFHPQFLQNGYFYVHYNRNGPTGGINAVIARYRANPPYATSTTADPNSAQVLLQFPCGGIHHGGWLGFGLDQNLYLSFGDAGSNGVNSQDLTANLQGKILRIDVDGPDNIPGNADDADPVSGKPYRIPAGNPFNGVNGDAEIIAYGFRNPWRCSIDRLTGDLWIGDVGQGTREEVDVYPAEQLGAVNFGWPCFEGTHPYSSGTCGNGLPPLTPPVLEYPHSGTLPPTTASGCAITGGCVYRGSDIPCLWGNYFFADYCTSTIWSFKRASDGSLINVVNRTAELAPGGGLQLNSISSFGEDNRGELYITDVGGEVYKILPRATSQGPDCNGNGTPDACEIANGDTPDANHNGIPDSCECDADFNQDGNSDQDDLDYLINVVAGGDNPTARNPDFNRDGNIDQGDIDYLINAIAGGGCP